MVEKKYDVELGAWEYQALLDNPSIFSMFADALKCQKKIGEFVILQMSRPTLEELVGWAAAEANHAKTRQEEELLGSACESLEVSLDGL